MTKRKFNEFWDKWTLAWMETDFYYQGTFLSVSSLCEVDNRTKFSIYKAYTDIKQVVKDSYFYNPVESNKEPTLNRYKRAAVLMYVICNYEPLKYHKDIHIPADPMMLKQRFAFYMATASILQDFRKEDIVPKKIYEVINKLGENDLKEGNDDFITSLYKDLFFSELYDNYNILTTANLLGLLFESVLGFEKNRIANINCSQ